VITQGKTEDELYTLGSLRKGRLWESIAVPEIRVQVVELADLLLADYPQPSTETARPSENRRVSSWYE